MPLMLKTILTVRQHSILHPERIVGQPESAGINRHVVGDEEPYRHRRGRVTTHSETNPLPAHLPTIPFEAQASNLL